MCVSEAALCWADLCVASISDCLSDDDDIGGDSFCGAVVTSEPCHGDRSTLVNDVCDESCPADGCWAAETLCDGVPEVGRACTSEYSGSCLSVDFEEGDDYLVL